MSKFKVATIGDAMITMNPVTTGPLRYVSTFERKMGGAELNFAIGCVRLGLQTKWISRLGNDEFGKVIYNFTRGEGIDVSEVGFVDDHPTSLNFKEIREGGDGKTYYYRFQSPILTFEAEDMHENILDDVDLLHLSGVFLAINPSNLVIVQRLIELAVKKGIPVSFDPNIRLKLWSIEEARQTYEKILPYIDILLTGLDEIQLITGQASKEDLEKFAEHYDIRDLVIKDGGNGSRLYRDGTWFDKPAFPVNVVDTVGAGDGFDAGYIYSYLKGKAPNELLAFANGVGALVTTVSGDNEGLPYLDEVLAFINNESVIER